MEGECDPPPHVPRLCSDGGETIGSSTIDGSGRILSAALAAVENPLSVKPEPQYVVDLGSTTDGTGSRAQCGEGDRVLAAQVVFAQDEVLFLGEDFFPWMVLALGAAMVVGNLIALVRPPSPDADAGAPSTERPRPPVGRAAVMIVVGLLAAGWGAASLLS